MPENITETNAQEPVKATSGGTKALKCFNAFLLIVILAALAVFGYVMLVRPDMVMAIPSVQKILNHNVAAIEQQHSKTLQHVAALEQRLNEAQQKANMLAHEKEILERVSITPTFHKDSIKPKQLIKPASIEETQSQEVIDAPINSDAVLTAPQPVEGMVEASYKASDAYALVQETAEDMRPLDMERDILTEGLSDVSDRTAMLEKELYQLREELKANAVEHNTSRLIVAAVKLRDAVHGAHPFEKELEAFKTLYDQENKELERHIRTLDEYAVFGVLSIHEVTQRFHSMADQVVSNARKAKVEPSLSDRIAIQLSQIVSIRKIQVDPDGKSTEDILAKATQKIKEHDIEGALEHLNTLEKIDKSVAAQWITQAQAMLRVRQASVAIFEYVIRLPKDELVAITPS